MSVTETQRLFIQQIIVKLKTDERLLGITIGGSYVSGEMDEYSDIDLIIVVKDIDYEDVLNERQLIAANLGSLIAIFTGEHVGEPRLSICLYDAPLMHVDLKFMLLEDFKSDRVENPVVLWERENLLTQTILENPRDYPPVDAQWIEDRFWVWVHYFATKLGRGELFEVIDGLSFLRGQVLAPLAKVQAGLKARGVRNLEKEIPYLVPDFCETIVSKHDACEIARALQYTIRLYRQLRDATQRPDLVLRSRAEVASTHYLQIVIEGLK